MDHGFYMDHFTAGSLQTTLTIADYFSKLAVVLMGSQGKRDNLNFFHRPDKAFL